MCTLSITNLRSPDVIPKTIKEIITTRTDNRMFMQDITTDVGKWLLNKTIDEYEMTATIKHGRIVF